MKLIKILPILFLVSAFACKQNFEELTKVEAAADIVSPVKVEAVKLSTDPLPVLGIGKVGSGEEAKLSFKVGGMIEGVYVNEGQSVKKGQLLAKVRSTEIDAQVLKAKNGLEKARRDLQRVESMFAQKAATRENVQDLTTNLEVRKADYEIATFNQQYARIVSPVNGKVLMKMVEANELAAPGQPIFLIGATGKNQQVLKVALSDRDISRIALGDAATVAFDAFPGLEFGGVVTQLSESADPRTGTYLVEVAINAKGKNLRNGYIGRINIQSSQVDPYYLLPIDAIVEGGQQNLKIFVPNAEGKKAKELEVQAIQINATTVVIQDPKGEPITQVITTGASYLKDGDAIKIL